MIKTVDNGVLRINGLSFLDFSSAFRGFNVVRKTNGARVPRFLLFWSGIYVAEVKKRYDLESRKNDD